MNEQVRKICELLKSTREEVRCAAALVLGELCDGDDGVVRTLGETLANGESAHLKGYVLEALEKIGSPSCLPFVLPLLQSGGEHREQAIRVVAGMGSGVVRTLASVRKGATGAERRAINQVLARVRGTQATKLLLDSLKEDEPALVQEMLLDIRQELRNASQEERKTFAEHVIRFVDTADARKDVEAKAAAVRILGYLEDPRFVPLLLRLSGPSRDPVLRRAALAALRNVPRPARGAEAMVKALLRYLGEKDFQGIVRPALDVLYPMPCSPGMLPALEELAKSRQPQVRRYALAKLGEIDSRRSAEVLLRHMDDSEPAVRDLAAESLGKLAAAGGVVLQRLMREVNPERAWVMARILKPCASRLSLEQVVHLGDRVVRLLDSENRLYEPLLFLMRQASEKETRAALMRRGLRKKRSRRFEDAARTFRLLERQGLFDAEVRYELAIALLKLLPRSVGSAARAQDPALELLLGLVPQGFPLFDHLRKEALLRPDELYYVGTHFLEQGNTVRALGAQILHLVMRKTPRSAISREARAKLGGQGMR